MPWKETDKVNERMQFISRLESGERMSDLCREFGISRKTGYKLKERFERYGVQGLYDASRRPHTHPRKTPDAVVQRVIEARRQFPTWGPKKLEVLLQDRYPGVHMPSPSTIGVIIKDAGLVQGRKKRRRSTPTGPRCVEAAAPNEVWTVDFKGQFRLGNKRYCYPLTLNDAFSRYSLSIEALPSTRVSLAQQALTMAFERYGLPSAIRSDNGVPFASTGRLGWSELSVWLLRLGIGLQRIEPGKPQQNGSHERFHRTLKAEATRPAQATMLAQQQCFDSWRDHYNEERPHEALGQKTPASQYSASTLPMPKALPTLSYPLCDQQVQVSHCGSIRFEGKRFYVGQVLHHQTLGLLQVDDPTWLVHFSRFELGYLDTEQRRFFPAFNPNPNLETSEKVLPMSPV
jgi:transposase InsO family protein